MSKMHDVVHAILAKGPRSTAEVVTECRRPGLPLRAETVELFLELSKGISQRDGLWFCRGGSLHERIVGAIRQAFDGGQTFLPIDRIGQYLDSRDAESVTLEDIAAACKETGQFRVKGKFVVRM